MYMFANSQIKKKKKRKRKRKMFVNLNRFHTISINLWWISFESLTIRAEIQKVYSQKINANYIIM